MFLWFRKNKEVARVEEDTKKGFEAVKKDITSMTGWIKHLDSEKNMQKKDIDDIKTVLSSMHSEIESLKNILAMMNEMKVKPSFQTPKQVFDKQAGVYAVQTGVETGVQTPNLDQFSVTEKAILWILLNSDMKLSYDDLAAILGKTRSTIRGQINRIKQKKENIISEITEQNGKKRVYIEDHIKEELMKNSKVRVEHKRKSKKKSKK